MVISLIRPSYKQGFARSAGESIAPHLWQGKVGDWIPELGNQGTILRDISGYHNHGTLTNMDVGTDWGINDNPRFPGHTLNYDASDDVIDITGSSASGHVLDIFPPMAILVWARPGTGGVGTGTLVSKRDSDVGSQWQLFTLNTNRLGMQADSGDINSLDNAYTDNVWQQIICNIDAGGNVFFYVNTVDFTDGGAGAGTFVHYDNNVSIGTRWSTYPATGYEIGGDIGRVTLYNRMLSSNERLELFVNPLMDLQMRRLVYKAPEVVAAAGILRRPYDNYMRNLITR